MSAVALRGHTKINHPHLFHSTKVRFIRKARSFIHFGKWLLPRWELEPFETGDGVWRFFYSWTLPNGACSSGELTWGVLCGSRVPLDPTLLTPQALHSPDRAVCKNWSHGPTSDLANRCWNTRNPAGSVSGSVLCGWWFWKGSAGVESLALGSPGRLFQTAGLHHHGQDTWMEALLSSLWCWAEVWMAMSPGRNGLSQMSHFQVLFFHPPARASF